MENTLTVSDQIIAVINALCDKMGVAIDWTGINLVPQLQVLAEKYVAYRASLAIMIICAFSLVLICVIAFIIISLKKKWFKAKSCYDMSYVPQWVIGITGILASISVILVNIHTLIVCNTFPEKLILEYVKTLIQ